MDGNDIQEKLNDVNEEAAGESKLDPEEFVRLMRSLGDDALASLAEQAEGPEDGEGRLELDEFVRLMRSLGDDALASLAEQAETPEAAEQAEFSEVTERSDVPEAGESPAEAEAAAGKPKRKAMHPRRKRILRRQIILLAIPTILLILTVANIIYYNTARNTDDPIMFAEENATDDVSCTTGSLMVNKVSVSVPSDGEEVYSISYTWAEDDIDYPSVPYASVVSYPGPDGVPDYEISLYRNDTVKKEELPSGKTADNWFDDWDTTGSDSVIYEPLSSGKINGFYIHPSETVSDKESLDRLADYTTYTYYFTVKGKKSISVYVLEGICYDPEKTADFSQIFEDCINKIKVK